MLAPSAKSFYDFRYNTSFLLPGPCHCKRDESDKQHNVTNHVYDRYAHPQDAVEALQRRLARAARAVAGEFPDPAKAEELVHKLVGCKDNLVAAGLAALCHPALTPKVRRCRF